MSVGPEGRSGDAQAHPQALCHTLGNPVPVPPTLGPGGQVGGGFLGELSDKGIGCQLIEAMFGFSSRDRKLLEALGFLGPWKNR